MSRKDSNDIKSVKQQLTYSNKRIAELDKLIENLYIDKVNGTISLSAFDRLIQKYETEHTELEERVAALKIRVEDTAKAKNDVDQWIEIMKGYMKSREIDRPLLISLIDTITVGELREENGEKVRDIRACLKNRKRRLFAPKRSSSTSKILDKRQFALRFFP